uniref:Putative 1 n=1 Tax=Ixodes ricinus TaxID=34613 RepID=V5ICB0_IXORI
MKNTGLFFFIMRTTRLIVAMFVLFAICQPAVATVALKGAENLAPECGPKNLRSLCKERNVLGTLEQIDVTTSRLRSHLHLSTFVEKELCIRNGFFVQNY